MIEDDITWLLYKIKFLQTLPNRQPTHRNIWAGSYDVWSSEQDRIDAIEIPKKIMREAEEKGFIKNNQNIYNLTEAGEKYLEEMP